MATARSIFLCYTWISISRTSLVVQWIRICLPMQGTQVRSLVWEDPARCRAAKATCHSYWSLCSSSLCCTTRQATATRSPHAETRERPQLSTTREGLCTATKTQCNQKLINLNKFLKALLFPTWFQNQMREKKKTQGKEKKSKISALSLT